MKRLAVVTGAGAILLGIAGLIGGPAAARVYGKPFAHPHHHVAAQGPFSYRWPRCGPYHWRGYTDVPGRGIIHEACNLPTSACPNEMRDVQ